MSSVCKQHVVFVKQIAFMPTLLIQAETHACMNAYLYYKREDAYDEEEQEQEEDAELEGEEEEEEGLHPWQAPCRPSL